MSDEPGSNSGQPQGFQGQAYITHADGSIEEIPKDELIGIDEFFNGWQQQPTTPQILSAEGWQESDDQHSPGSGTPAYRVVHKTLRIVAFPPWELKFPNLRVFIGNGDVSRGGMRANGTWEGRNPRTRIIPEFGRIADMDGVAGYVAEPNMHYNIEAWAETVEAVNYVEVIVHVDLPADTPYDTVLAVGREKAASIRTLLDLQFGDRLLSMPITEEVGEVFEDWHWNRRINTGLFGAESQAALQILTVDTYLNEVGPEIDAQVALPMEERQRIALASRWYWRALADTELATKFIAWWLVIECLEMPNTTNIKPVRERLAVLFGNTEQNWAPLVGRLYGLRSQLVHGNVSSATTESTTLVENLARVLLEARILQKPRQETEDALRKDL